MKSFRPEPEPHERKSRQRQAQHIYSLPYHLYYAEWGSWAYVSARPAQHKRFRSISGKTSQWKEFGSRIIYASDTSDSNFN